MCFAGLNDLDFLLGWEVGRMSSSWLVEDARAIIDTRRNGLPAKVTRPGMYVEMNEQIAIRSSVSLIYMVRIW